MTYRVKNITIAVALALVAALLTIFYVTNFQRNVRQDETNVPVFVAKQDIPAGTAGADAARKGMLVKTELVPRSVVPDIEVLESSGGPNTQQKLAQSSGLYVLLAVTDTQIQKLFHGI